MRSTESGAIGAIKSRGTSLLASVAVVAVVWSVPNGASAADLLLDPPIETPEIVTKPAGGWYLRGDISYQSHHMEEIYYTVVDNGVKRFTRNELEESFGIRGGLGYQINENFRVDATLGYKFDTDFTGATSGVCASIADPAVFIPCTSTDTTSLSSYTLMANGYFDLGNFGGFTPYVGGGIGGAYVTWNGLRNSIDCGAGDVNCAVDTHPGNSSWRFAYALHAGVSYDVAHNLKLDLGYSYERISGGAMFDYIPSSVVSADLFNGAQGHDKGFTDHIFRAGIRYQIW